MSLFAFLFPPFCRALTSYSASCPSSLTSYSASCPFSLSRTSFLDPGLPSPAVRAGVEGRDALNVAVVQYVVCGGCLYDPYGTKVKKVEHHIVTCGRRVDDLAKCTRKREVGKNAVCTNEENLTKDSEQFAWSEMRDSKIS